MTMTSKFRAFLRWIIRVRTYSDRGMYWLPYIDTLIGLYGMITIGLITGIGIVLSIRIIAAVIGYVDIYHARTLQYQNEFNTNLNPIFSDIHKKINKR